MAAADHVQAIRECLDSLGAIVARLEAGGRIEADEITAMRRWIAQLAQTEQERLVRAHTENRTYRHATVRLRR